MRFNLPNLRWKTFKFLVCTHVVEFRSITKTNFGNFLHLSRCETCLPSSETRLEKTAPSRSQKGFLFSPIKTLKKNLLMKLQDVFGISQQQTFVFDPCLDSSLSDTKLHSQQYHPKEFQSQWLNLYYFVIIICRDFQALNSHILALVYILIQIF